MTRRLVPGRGGRGGRLAAAALLGAAVLLVAGCAAGGDPDPSTTPADPWAAWDAALADVDSSSARWLAVGDSLTEGQGAATVDDRWIDLTRDALRDAHPVDGVAGGVGYRPAVFATYPPDSPWASWAVERSDDARVDFTAPSLGFRALDLAPGAVVSYDVSGTDLDLWWSSGGGTFTWSVDGGDPAEVDTSDAAAGVNLTTVTDLDPGPHTVTVTAEAATDVVVLHGLTQYDGDRDAGVVLLDSAHTGYTTADFTDQLAGWLEAVAAAEPDLVTITLGVNDASLSSPDEVAADYTALIGGLQSLDAPPTVVVVDEFSAGLGDTAAWQGTRDEYERALQEVVDDTGVASLSLGEALAEATGAASSSPGGAASGTGASSSGASGSGATATPTGEAATLGSLIAGDGIHPNDAGQRAIARYMTEALGR